MSKLMTAEDYEREIADTERLIRVEEAAAARYGKAFDIEVSIHSLTARRNALIDEMRALGFERQRKTA
jgi:hypothetical protein